MIACIYEHILGLDISVANSYSMNISYGSQQLIRVDFYQNIWYHLLHLKILLHNFVHSFRDIVHHNIQINLIRLVTISIKWLPHFNAIRVVQHFQNLKLSIFVSLVLKHLLDCHGFSCLCNSCLKYNPKWPISHNFLSIVR